MGYRAPAAKTAALQTGAGTHLATDFFMVRPLSLVALPEFDIARIASTDALPSTSLGLSITAYNLDNDKTTWT